MLPNASTVVGNLAKGHRAQKETILVGRKRLSNRCSLVTVVTGGRQRHQRCQKMRAKGETRERKATSKAHV